jgi:membrane protein implicated in regulation of membrane protease activity
MEVLWIATGVISLAAGVRFAVTTGGNKVYIFALMAIISFLFAWLRHKQRKKN